MRVEMSRLISRLQHVSAAALALLCACDGGITLLRYRPKPLTAGAVPHRTTSRLAHCGASRGFLSPRAGLLGWRLARRAKIYFTSRIRRL